LLGQRLGRIVVDDAVGMRRPKLPRDKVEVLDRRSVDFERQCVGKFS
jgi:hypothetical protein